MNSVEDPRIQSALAELQMLIQERYPEATFDIFHGEDPDGVRLQATVDVEDTDEVMDVVIDKLYEFQVEQGLPVYVLPVPPLERVAEELKKRKVQPGFAPLPPLLP